MENDIKKFNDYIKEDITTDAMKDTTVTYNKYKNRVKSFIKEEDLNKSRENFEKFINSLPENEKSAADLLRTNFSVEILQIRIDKLKNDKIEIDKEITTRLQELNTLKSKIK